MPLQLPAVQNGCPLESQISSPLWGLCWWMLRSIVYWIAENYECLFLKQQRNNWQEGIEGSANRLLRAHDSERCRVLEVNPSEKYSYQHDHHILV